MTTVKQLKQLVNGFYPASALHLPILFLAILAMMLKCQTTGFGEPSGKGRLSAHNVPSLESKAVQIDGHWYAKDRILFKFKDNASVEQFKGESRIKLSQVPQHLELPEGVTIENGGYSKLKARIAGKAGDLTVLDYNSYQVAQLNGSIGLEECLRLLKKQPLLEYAELDGLVSIDRTIPNDPGFNSQWHHETIATPLAWDFTRGSSNVTIAILDSGIDLTRTEFSGRLVPGHDFVNTGNDPDGPADDNGHGTAVAGVLAANADNGVSIAGVDWHCRIMPVKIFDSDGFGFASWIADGVDFARANGAKVINFSGGGPSHNQTLANAIVGAVGQGVVFVAASGNEAERGLSFPGRMPQTIAVGATDRNDRKSSFSNWGPGLDLVAPGQDIFTINISSFQRTTFWDGTSFSAPQVSGVASLIASLRPDVSTETMRSILCESAEDQVGDAFDTPGFDEYYGCGRLNVHRAILVARELPIVDLAITDVIFSPSSINRGEHPTAVSYRITNNGPDQFDNSVISFTVELVLSDDQNLGDSDDINIGETEWIEGNLAAGGFWDLQLDGGALGGITIPDVSFGQYTNFANIRLDDPTVALDLNAENNNATAASTLTVKAPTVDLAITDLEFSPSNLSPSEHPTNVSYRITNFGPDAFDGSDLSITIELFLSHDQTFSNSDDVSIGETEWTIGNLPAGAFSDLTLNEIALSGVVVPEIAPGEYTIFAEVRISDPNSAVDPNNGNNHTVPETTLTFEAPAVDLSTTDLTFSPSFLSPNQNPSAVSYRITNDGPDEFDNSGSFFTVELYLSEDDEFGNTDDAKIGETEWQDGILPVGGFWDLELNENALSGVPIPNVAFGDYRVFAAVRIDNPLSGIDVSIDNNHTVSGSILHVDAPFVDLAITKLITPSILLPGQHPLGVSYRIINSGSGAFDSSIFPFVVELYLSEDPVFGNADDVGIGETEWSQSILPPGGFWDLVVDGAAISSLGIPDIQTGQYYGFGRVRIDNPAFTVDVNESNNSTGTENTVSIIPIAASVLRIVASDGDVGDQFGSSVAMNADILVVGAPGDDESRGATYVFKPKGPNSDSWLEIAKLTASDGTAGDRFGVAVDIEKDTIVVGAEGKTNFRGAVYVFAESVGVDENWTEIRKITASDGAMDDRFGRSVAISGDHLAVAAVDADAMGLNSGAAYVFERNYGGIENWGVRRKLVASDGGPSDGFGASLAMDADLLVIGAPAKDILPARTGAGYVFQRHHGGADDWGEITKLIPNEGYPGDGFGVSVAIDRETIVAGADSFCSRSIVADPGLCDLNDSSAYVFERDPESSTDWIQVIRLTGMGSPIFFGVSLAIEGDTLLIGAMDGFPFSAEEQPEEFSSGAWYILKRDPGIPTNWRGIVDHFYPDFPSFIPLLVDNSAWPVALDGDRIVGGAFGLGSFQGSVFVYSNPGLFSDSMIAHKSGGRGGYFEADEELAFLSFGFDSVGLESRIPMDLIVPGATFVFDAWNSSFFTELVAHLTNGTDERIDMGYLLFDSSHLEIQNGFSTFFESNLFNGSQYLVGSEIDFISVTVKDFSVSEATNGRTILEIGYIWRFFKSQNSLIRDSNLEKPIRNALQVVDRELTEADLVALTILSASDSEITNLAGLEKAVNLIELDLGDNQITDLSPLIDLPNLQILDLSRNRISDVTVLTSLSSLQSLEIRFNDFDLTDDSEAAAILDQLAAAGIEVIYKTTYDGWQEEYFSLEDLNDPAKESTLWGHLANPDGDTLPNLIEFFMGLDPNEASTGDAFISTDESGGLIFTYRRAKDVVPSTGAPEYTTDFINWTTDGILEERVADMGTYIIIERTIPVNPDDQAIFVRLNVRNAD